MLPSLSMIANYNYPRNPARRFRLGARGTVTAVGHYPISGFCNCDLAATSPRSTRTLA